MDQLQQINKSDYIIIHFNTTHPLQLLQQLEFLELYSIPANKNFKINIWKDKWIPWLNQEKFESDLINDITASYNLKSIGIADHWKKKSGMDHYLYRRLKENVSNYNKKTKQNTYHSQQK